MGQETSVLRRIARPAAPPAALTPARALRLALTRAAEQSIAVPMSVIGISEDEAPLDDHLARLEGGLLILALHEDGGPSGVIALDAEARAAVIEAQTIRRVSAASPELRAPTAADAALVLPLLQSFLREAEAAVTGTAREGWLHAPQPGRTLPGPREVAMLLPDGRYRSVRLTLDLGAGGRQGLLVLLHRLAPPAPALPADKPTGLPLAPQVLAAPVTVSALLHRLQLPLAEAEGLAVGQVLPLPGVTVASVRLRTASFDLGPGRLGQVAGRRAVRLEQPVSPHLSELSPDPSLPRLPQAE